MRFDLTIESIYFRNNNKIEVYDKNTWRPYCHINDFARLIYIVLTSNKNKLTFKYLMQVVIKIIIQKKWLLKILVNIFQKENSLCKEWYRSSL